MNKNAIISLIVGLVIGGLAVGLFMYFGVSSTGTFLGKQLTSTTTPTPTVTTTPALSTSGVTSTVPVPADLAPLVDTPTQTWAVAYWITKPDNIDAEPALVPVVASNDKGDELKITWKMGWVTRNQLLDFKNMDEKSRYNFAAGIMENPSGSGAPGQTEVFVHIIQGSLKCFNGTIVVT